MTDRIDLTPRQKLALIRLVEEGKESVSSVCRRYGISRKTFYKWRDRYLIAKAKKTKPLEALSPKKRTYLRQHPRRSANLFMAEILEVVKRTPSSSSRGVAKHVCLSEKGVRGVLCRLGLATQKERRRFQRLHISFRPWLAPIFIVEYLLGSLLLPEIPFIAPLLATIPKKRRPTALYLPLLLLAFGAFFKLNQVLFIDERTLFGRIGLVLSEIALIFGMFFFLYSVKYYLTLALVLLFSRGADGSANGVLNGLRNGFNGLNGRNGRLSRVFNGLLNGRFNGLIRNGRLNGRLNSLFNGRLNGRFNGLNGRLNGRVKRGFDLFNGLKNGLNGLNGINGLNGLNGRFNGLNANNLNQVKLKEKPFVSIHLPFYNEKRVAGRILEACTKLNYPNFEVLVLDDSNDGTTEIVEEWTRKDNRIRLVHRPNREGWKGGALRYALSKMDKRAEYIIVLDADFIPFPDTIDWFLRYFYFLCGGLGNVKKSKIAAVQGYQWHVLNKDENWITRGIRGEYSGSYIIERSGTELFGSLKQIAGSVYMIRADVLKEFGWRTSITEDFQLTLRLYEKGYKVIYTPYIQAPAECVSTLKRLIRQRMRWAEGHTHNVRKMFKRLWYSPKMNLAEKLEFLYLSPYYLQSLFFLVGTLSWLAAEIVFRAKLPFWTATWGWSLVFTNMFSLILMNATGLFIEESDRHDYKGLLSFLATTYIVVPFQAYAAIKGLFEKEEGHWFRTPKTGLITIELVRGHFVRLFGWLFPRRAGERVRARRGTRMSTDISADQHRFSVNQRLALETAFNNFDDDPPFRWREFSRELLGPPKKFAFLGLKVARRVVFSKATLALLLVVTMFLNYLAVFTVETGKKEKMGEMEEMGEKGEMGGGTEIFRGDPVNTNLIENEEAAEIKKGVVQAAESDEEVYRWTVNVRGSTYSFGLQEPRGIKPVVKMENERRGGNFVRFTPDTRMQTNTGVFGSLKRMLTNKQMYVEPEVDGNSIKWEIGEGITARYTSLADRVKADYVIENKASSVQRLAFSVKFSDTEDNPLVFEQNKDGSISLIMDNYSEEVFRFLAPNAKDAKGVEGKATMNIQKTGQGTAILTITLDQKFLNSATYPITVDPTVLTSDAELNTATAYGNQRQIIRDSYGKLLAVYSIVEGVSWAWAARWSNDSGATWQSERTLLTNAGSNIVAQNVSVAISDSKLHLADEQKGGAPNYIVYRRYTIGRDGSNNITGIGSSNNGYADAAGVTLDSSEYAYRPSLIVTNMGSNDHVAVAWSFYGSSKGTKRGGARFMHCLLSNDCTDIAFWCGANANSGSGECGTPATGIDIHGDADEIMGRSDTDPTHVVLNQMNPTGDASTTYSKDLVVVMGDDDTSDLGTAYTAWDDGGTDDKWAGWSWDVDNVADLGWEGAADGYNLTMAQDNKSKELVLSHFYHTIYTYLMVQRLGEGDQPDAAISPWLDMSFPTDDNKDPTVGVDNENGIYYNFYKNTDGYIAFRYADGAHWEDKLGYDTAGGSSSSVENTIRGSKFTLSEKTIFTRMRAYISGATPVCITLFRAAIYNDDGGSPSTLVVQSDSQNECPGVGQWVIFSIETTALPAGIYWLVVNSNDPTPGALHYNSGDANQGVYESYTYASFPFDFPTPIDGFNTNKYSIYAMVGWSGEIVLDQANADNAFPSVTEDEIWETGNKKMDLIYTQGSATYTVFYHTWHFEERYSHGRDASAPSGYSDEEIFMDEDDYSDLASDDTNYVDQIMMAAGGVDTVVYIFKVKNTDRTNNPDISPKFVGRSQRAPSTDNVYLKIYNRNTPGWETPDSTWTESSAGANTDFTISPNDITSNHDYYYFADDWVYFLVYQENSDAINPFTFSADEFNTSALFVPERTILLLLLVPFMPRLAQEFRRRKWLAKIKVKNRMVKYR